VSNIHKPCNWCCLHIWVCATHTCSPFDTITTIWKEGLHVAEMILYPLHSFHNPEKEYNYYSKKTPHNIAKNSDANFHSKVSICRMVQSSCMFSSCTVGSHDRRFYKICRSLGQEKAILWLTYKRCEMHPLWQSPV